MNERAHVVRIVLALSLFVTASAQTTASPLVRTDAGVVRGVSGWATQAFLGIPFAAPPVGAARWRAPQPVTPWAGARDATRLALPCATEGFGDGVLHIRIQAG